MTRLPLRFLGFLGPPLLAVALGLFLLAVLGVVSWPAPVVTAQATADAVDAAATPTESCYSWDLFNYTFGDANGLRLYVTGIETYTHVYLGSGNPFGAPASASYDSGQDTLTLNFGGTDDTLIPPAFAVQMGLCAQKAVRTVQFYWLTGQTPIVPPLVAPGLAWSWPATETLQLTLTNSTGISATLLSLDVLAPEQPLDVDDLEPAVVEYLPLASEFVAEAFELAPGAVVSYTTSFAGAGEPVTPGKPYVIQVELGGVEDPSVVFNMFAQIEAPTPGAGNQLFLPQLSK